MKMEDVEIGMHVIDPDFPDTVGEVMDTDVELNEVYVQFPVVGQHAKNDIIDVAPEDIERFNA